MADAISKSDVEKARAELARMRRALASWLKYRRMNDAVAAGRVPSRLPVKVAQEVAVGDRDWATEQKLATQLHTLLSEVMPDAMLPGVNVSVDRDAATKLAEIAITGSAPVQYPAPQGIIWMWPVLIVGGLLLAITMAIRTYADVAKEKERLACIRAGACTDYGFWLKMGGIAIVGWFVWTQAGGKEAVSGLLKRR